MASPLPTSCHERNNSDIIENERPSKAFSDSPSENGLHGCGSDNDENHRSFVDDRPFSADIAKRDENEPEKCNAQEIYLEVDDGDNVQYCCFPDCDRNKCGVNSSIKKVKDILLAKKPDQEHISRKSMESKQPTVKAITPANDDSECYEVGDLALEVVKQSRTAAFNDGLECPHKTFHKLTSCSKRSVVLECLPLKNMEAKNFIDDFRVVSRYRNMMKDQRALCEIEEKIFSHGEKLQVTRNDFSCVVIPFISNISSIPEKSAKIATPLQTFLIYEGIESINQFTEMQCHYETAMSKERLSFSSEKTRGRDLYSSHENTKNLKRVKTMPLLLDKKTVSSKKQELSVLPIEDAMMIVFEVDQSDSCKTITKQKWDTLIETDETDVFCSCSHTYGVHFGLYIVALKKATVEYQKFTKLIFCFIIVDGLDFMDNDSLFGDEPVTGDKIIHEQRNQYAEVPCFVNVEGIISDSAVDPPGQQSSYIPPGDTRHESYRISTFENYPRDSVVDIRILAENGFHYTGFHDRVKCYSCGRTVERWERADDPKDKRFHRPDCEFSNGRARDNVPVSGRFQARFSSQRIGSTRPNVSTPARHSPIDNMDRSRQNDFRFQSGGITITSNQNFPPPSTPASQNRQWRLANVISADHRRFLSNLFLNREIDRLASFCRWPTSRPNVSPVSLAKAGFFYLGDMDRTQCFSCGGVLRNWTVHDDAMNEHRANFPACNFTRGTDNRNVPVPIASEPQQELRTSFPCRYPYNPHMRSQASRVDTFDRRWPAGRINATPQEIAEAGFFYLGERDKVKCWYCNGGLQNWEVDDSPWVEHSKWFPTCQFLLQQRGQHFVFRHLSLNAHLSRPIIGRQEGAVFGENARSQSQSSRGEDIPPEVVPGFSRVAAPSPPPAIIDPQEELRKRKERVEKELKENENVKNVLIFGYDTELVRKVLDDRLSAGEAADPENIFDGVSSLLDAVQEREKEIRQEEEQATRLKIPAGASNFRTSSPSTPEMETTIPSAESQPPSGIMQVSGFNVDSEDEDMDLYGSLPSRDSERAAAQPPQEESEPSSINIPEDLGSLRDMYEQRMDERMCKICFDRIADMVFVPCGHIACCLQCTEAIRHCPACRVKIEKAIRVYTK